MVPHGEPEDLHSTVEEVVRLSLPSIGSEVLAQAVSLTTVMWVSRMDDPYLLGSVGLGTMVQNVFGFSLGRGLNSALDTRISQSYGAGRLDLMRLDIQRAQVLSLAISVPSMLGLLFAEPFFLALGIHPRTAKEAGDFVRGGVLSMPFNFHFFATRAFLRNVKLPNPDYWVRVATALVHPLWLWIFLEALPLGAFGAGLALSCSNMVGFGLLTAYVMTRKPGPVKEEAWVPLPIPTELVRATDDGFEGYLRVAIPSALLMWTEWWVYEIMYLLAGLLGTEPLAAHTAVSQLSIIVWMVPGGVQASTNTIVGNALGRGLPREAKVSLVVACTAMAALFIPVSLVIYMTSGPLGRFFSTDPEVLQSFVSLGPLVALFVLTDAIQTVLEGGLTGLGLQKEASVAKVVSMIAVRLGGAYLLGLRWKMGLRGVWLGSLGGMVLTLFLFARILWRTDYASLAAAARERLHVDSDEAGFVELEENYYVAAPSPK